MLESIVLNRTRAGVLESVSNAKLSEAAGRGGFACSGVPKNCYMIEVHFSLFNPNFTIFRRYYKMQFVRLKSSTNSKNMYRNQIWFSLKIKDAPERRLLFPIF